MLFKILMDTLLEIFQIVLRFGNRSLKTGALLFDGIVSEEVRLGYNNAHTVQDMSLADGNPGGYPDSLDDSLCWVHQQQSVQKA